MCFLLWHHKCVDLHSWRIQHYENSGVFFKKNPSALWLRRWAKTGVDNVNEIQNVRQSGISCVLFSSLLIPFLPLKQSSRNKIPKLFKIINYVNIYMVNINYTIYTTQASLAVKVGYHLGVDFWCCVHTADLTVFKCYLCQTKIEAFCHFTSHFHSQP